MNEYQHQRTGKSQKKKKAKNQTRPDQNGKEALVIFIDIYLLFIKLIVIYLFIFPRASVQAKPQPQQQRQPNSVRFLFDSNQFLFSCYLNLVFIYHLFSHFHFRSQYQNDKLFKDRNGMATHVYMMIIERDH